MNNFWTVVGFTIRNKIRTKSFLIMTVIIAVILGIGVNAPYLISKFSGGDDGPKKIGYIEGQSPDVSEALKLHYENPAVQGNLRLIAYPDAGTVEANDLILKQAITAGEIEGYIVFEADHAAGFPKVIYKSEKLIDNTSSGLSAALQTVKLESGLKDAGLTEEQKTKLFAPIVVQSEQISVTEDAAVGKTEAQRGLAMGFVYAVMILLFMGIFITSQLIATEITAEKSSRVMEILVTSVSPLTQMFGKIVGMFLVGLMQISVYVIVFILNVLLPHNAEVLSEININFSDIDPLLYVFAPLFYLMGYFLYSTLFAAVGSIVSRTEDLAQALMPITLLSLAGFYIGIFGMTTPDSTLIYAASFIPFFTPFVMFLRIGLTDPALWEILLSIGLLAVSIFLFGWLSAKIYRTGVLMYGKRPSFKELRKAMKAFEM